MFSLYSEGGNGGLIHLPIEAVLTLFYTFYAVNKRNGKEQKQRRVSLYEYLTSYHNSNF